MSLQRFREPQFQGCKGNRREPWNRQTSRALLMGCFLVPGTMGTDPRTAVPGIPPSKGGNRDQCQPSGMTA
jgi:hypothetical protein